jgi:hypothetical protein
MAYYLFIKKYFFFLFFFSISLLKAQVNDTNKLYEYQNFARLYGYIRYFHPSENNKSINWETFIYKGLEYIEKNKDIDEIKRLETLFSEITTDLELSYQPINLSINSKHENEYGYWQHYGYGFSDINWYVSKIIGIHDSIKRMNGIGFAHSFKKVNNEPYFFHFTYKNDSCSGLNPVKITFDFYNIETHKNQSFEYYPKCINNWVNDTFVMNPLGREFYLYTTINIEKACAIDIEKLRFSRKDTISCEQKELFSINFDIRDLSQIENIQDNIHFSVKKQINSTEDRKFLSIVSESNTQLNKLFKNGFEKYTTYSFKLGNQIYGKIPLTLSLNTSTSKSKPKIISDNLEFSIRDKALTSVIITWNIIQHFSPHINYITTNWDNELLSALSMADTCTSETSIETIIKNMMSKLNDGHAVIFSKENSSINSITIKTEIIDEKVIIIENQHDELCQGDIVLEVNHKEIKYIISNLMSISPGSIQRKQYIAKNEALSINKDDSISLKILRGVDTICIENIKAIDFNNDVKTKGILLLEDNIFKVDLYTITESEFLANLSLLKEAKGIIFDCRKGIRISHEILGYLIKDTIYYQSLYTPIILYPDRYKMVYDTSGRYPVKPKSPYISCPSIFIIGANNISSEEGFLSLVDYYNIGITIGQPTAGCNGVYNRFYCFGITVHFTGMEVRAQDNKQFYNIGIKPRYYIQNSLEEIQKGIDASIDKAIDLIKNL